MLASADEERAARVRTAIDELALFGPAHEPNEGRLQAPERATRLEQVVLAAQACAVQVAAAIIQPTPLDEVTRSTINTWLGQLSKLLSDNVVISVTPAPAPAALPTPDRPVTPVSAPESEPISQPYTVVSAQADPLIEVPTHMPQAPIVDQIQPAPDIICVTELSKDNKGSFRLGSTTDTDATYRVHSNDGSKTDFGYNVGLLVTQHFIREIQVATGAQPDPVGLPNLMRAQIEHHDLIPPKVIYDAAAGEGTYGPSPL